MQTSGNLISEDAMKSLVKSNPHLKHLNFLCCDLGDSFLEFLSENLADISTVEFCDNLADISFAGIAQLILRCVSVTYIHFSPADNLHANGFEYRKFEQEGLKSVTFGALNTDTALAFNQNFKQFVSVITGFDHVKFHITPLFEMTSLECLLKFSPNIRELSLPAYDQCILTGEQVSFLLTNCASITVLNCGSLSDSEILHVFLNKNKVVIVSFLCHDKVTTATVIQVIASNKQLKIVNCYSCPLVNLNEVEAYITENECDVEIFDME
jgi:hypothetical protein